MPVIDSGLDSDLSSVLAPFLDLDLISEVCEPIKSGKEATVYRCRASPGSGHTALALKVYRPRAQRSFKNDALYREGSLLTRIGGGNTRAARALRNGTRFGREVQSFSWTEREWEVLQRLHAAGLPVPAPVHAGGGAILMELFCDARGDVAAPLASARLSPSTAAGLFAALCADVEQMLWLDVLHGDLSPYNVLWNGEGYRIIDFPQAVDPRFHGSALALLQRDLENVGRFCARHGEIPDPRAVASAMWQRFQHGEPP
jgi:RIO kinase 1